MDARCIHFVIFLVGSLVKEVDTKLARSDYCIAAGVAEAVEEGSHFGQTEKAGKAEEDTIAGQIRVTLVEEDNFGLAVFE